MFRSFLFSPPPDAPLETPDLLSRMEAKRNGRFDNFVQQYTTRKPFVWKNCLVFCAVLVALQGLIFHKIPSVLVELQFAGNGATGQQVLDAWNLPPWRIAGAMALNLLLIPWYLPLLLLAVKMASERYLDGAKEWRGLFGLIAAGIAVAAVVENLSALLWLLTSQNASHPNAALPVAFFFASVKTLCAGAVFLYVLFGFAESAWVRGAWDAVRVCGISLFAAVVGPCVLLFGGQGAAIFGATVEQLHKSATRTVFGFHDAVPFLWTLAAALTFSLMCWGAARYAVSYKAEEKGQKSVLQIAQTDETMRRSAVAGSTPSSPPLNLPSHSTRAKNRVNPTNNDLSDQAIAAQVREGWTFARDWVPRFCGAAPGFFLGFITLAVWSNADPNSFGETHALWLGAGFCMVSLVTSLWMRFIHRWTNGLSLPATVPDRENIIHQRKIVFNNGYVGFSLFFGLAAVLGCISPATLQWTWNIGPLAAWFLSFSLMVPFFTSLVWLGRRKRKPFLALFLAYGYLINAASLNDDHGLRHRYGPDVAAAWKNAAPNAANAAAPSPRTLNDAFDDWLKRRHDPDPEKPYPVVFVAAAGGGIVAGGLLTATMAQIHDKNNGVPDLPDHLFAISSVSGGSLGAAAYVTLRRCDPLSVQNETLGQREKTVFTTDMLSPSVASLLGPELVQRFLPVAVPHLDTAADYVNEYAMDRGRALDLAFEHAIDRGFPGAKKMLQETVTAYPTPAQSGLPALFLNTTCVQTGERMVIATLRPDDPPNTEKTEKAAPLPFETLYDVDPHVDVPLSTASCLSARFPVVSPPAFLPQWRKTHLSGTGAGDETNLTVKQSYVDGGYCENSGVETVLDVVAALQARDAVRQKCGKRGKWFPVIISIHTGEVNYSEEPGRADVLPQNPRAPAPRRGSGFDEVLGPASAFFSGWGGPARPIYKRAHLLYGEKFVELNFPKPVLLSWYMSETQYDQAASQARTLLGPSAERGKETPGDRLRRLIKTRQPRESGIRTFMSLPHFHRGA